MKLSTRGAPWRAWMGLLGAVGCLACGGGGGGEGAPDGPSCPADAEPVLDAAPSPDVLFDPRCEGAPCGGDPTGDWEWIASCADGIGHLPGCPESTVEIHATDYAQGTASISADGQVMLTIDEQGAARGQVPPSCFGLTDCDQVEVAFGTQGFMASCRPVGVADACGFIEAPETCDCDASLVLEDAVRTATIELTGATTLRWTWGGEVIDFEYCVTADELWLHGTRFDGIDYRERFRRLP